MKIENAVIAVTGAAQGIGFAFARRALEMGARVSLSDVNENGLTQAAAMLQPIAGDRAHTCRCDVTSEDSVRHWAQQVQSRFGRLDLLVNNAAAQQFGPGSIDDVDYDRYKLSFDINVLGNIRTVSAFLPGMKAAGAGYVVNTASSLAIRPNAVIQHLLPYETSKGAVLTQTWALAHGLKRHGIKVSLFCPGLTATRPGQTSSRPKDMGWFDGVREDLTRPSTLDAAIDVLIEGLQREDFLICSDDGYADSIVRFAQHGLNPLANYY